MNVLKIFGLRVGQFGSLAAVCFALLPAWSQAVSDRLPPLLNQRPTNVVAYPYNAVSLQGGIGPSKPLDYREPLVAARCSWSMSLRLTTDGRQPTAILAGVGRTCEAFPRYLALIHWRPALWAGGTGTDHVLEGDAVLTARVWHSLAVSVDDQGGKRLYVDGIQVASGMLSLGVAVDVLEVAPSPSPWHAGRRPSGMNAPQYSSTSSHSAAASRTALLGILKWRGEA